MCCDQKFQNPKFLNLYPNRPIELPLKPSKTDAGDTILPEEAKRGGGGPIYQPTQR
jgi:hypothetical protein